MLTRPHIHAVMMADAKSARMGSSERPNVTANCSMPSTLMSSPMPCITRGAPVSTPSDDVRPAINSPM